MNIKFTRKKVKEIPLKVIDVRAAQDTKHY